MKADIEKVLCSMTDTVQSDNVIDPVDASEDEEIFNHDELLGRYISHHPVNRFRLIIQAGLVYFIITTVLQLLFSELDDQTASIIVIFFFAAVALGLSWYVLHLWNREVIVYERGFNYREGSVIADFQYKEVMSFRQKAERLRYFGGILRRNVYTFTVRTHRDEVIKLTNLYTDIEKLGNNLEVGINSVLRGQIRQTLSDGESVSFGDSFEVSETGMAVDGQRLAWDDFVGAKTQRGRLIIASKTDENWYEISLDEVDNLTILSEILREKLPTTN